MLVAATLGIAFGVLTNVAMAVGLVTVAHLLHTKKVTFTDLGVLVVIALAVAAVVSVILTAVNTVL